MQPGPNRLNSNAAADRKRDAERSDIFPARSERSNARNGVTRPSEPATRDFEDSAATREGHDATEQTKLPASSTATPRRDDRCELKDGIRSGLTLFIPALQPNSYIDRLSAAVPAAPYFCTPQKCGVSRQAALRRLALSPNPFMT